MALLNFTLNLANVANIKKMFGNIYSGAKDATASMHNLSASVLDSTKAFKNLNNASKLLHFASLTTTIGNFAAGTRVVASEIRAATRFVDGFAEKGDKIAKTSRLVGMSAHDYQAFSSEARHAGLSIEEMDSALKRFSINVGKARAGDKNTLGKFDSLLPKSLSEYKNNTEIITALAASYSKLGSAEDKAFVSQELFGKSGLKMTELLSQGSESLASKINDYEASFSDDGAKNAEAFNDALQDMTEQLEVVKASVAQELFPTFIDFFKEFRGFLKENGAELRQNISSVAKELTTFVKWFLPVIVKAGSKILSFLNGINSGFSALIIGVGALSPVLAPAWPFIRWLVEKLKVIKGFLLKVVGLVKKIFVVLPKIAVFIKGIAAAITGPMLATIGLIVAAVALWGKVAKDVYDNWELVKSVFADGFWEGVKTIASAAWQLLKDLVKSVADFAADVCKAINSFISEYFVNPIKSAIDWITNGIKGILDSLSNIPLIGKLFGNGNSVIEVVDSTRGGAAPNNIAETVGNTTVTRTDRFSVDFQNMPRGVTVTPPSSGNFDYSKGYTLAPGF